MAKARMAVWLWYFGGNYRGFQSQRDGPTVQDTVAAALQTLGITPRPAPAGRTDKGVHARMQVLSLRAAWDGSPAELGDALNRALPDDVGVSAVELAPEGFHAQWSCAGKEYRYRLALTPPPERWAPFAWHPPFLYARTLDLVRLERLLQAAVGTRDFSAFHESSSPRKPRTLWSVQLAPVAQAVWEVRLRGDAFGRYQVRYLVGSAVAAAAGAIPEEAFLRGLEGEGFYGVKAAAHGLVLWETLYPPPLDPFRAEQRAAPRALPREGPFSS